MEQFEKEFRDSLPKFLRPGYGGLPSAIESGLVARWIDACIEYREGSRLPSKEYLASFQDWSGMNCTVNALNKVLRRLGLCE